jgi:hypothetical protein
MTDARPENVILRCSIKSRKDVWVWADISPSDWTVTLRHNDKEVGVFERQNNSNLFIHGHVYLTRGTQNGCKTEWSSIVRESKGIGPRPLIDRPQTYGVRDFHNSFNDCILVCSRAILTGRRQISNTPSF